MRQFLLYEDLTLIPVLVTVKEHSVPDVWPGMPKAQEWAVRTLLNQIDAAIHGWIDIAEPGQQLTSSRRVVMLFGMMEKFGMYAAIPEVTWDPEGCKGMVKIGNVLSCYKIYI